MKSSAFFCAIAAALSLLGAPALAIGPGDEGAPVPSRNASVENTNATVSVAASVPASSVATINNTLPNNLGTQVPSTSSAASILQVFLSLSVVLGLLIAVAYALKRFGPQPMKGGANLRIVGGMSLGGRERVLVLEIGDQWLVVGAAPGRVNALATLPKQNGLPIILEKDAEPDLANEKNFATWLKQIMEKRNGA